MDTETGNGGEVHQVSTGKVLSFDNESKDGSGFQSKISESAKAAVEAVSSAASGNELTNPILTTMNGIPVSDNENTLKSYNNGASLLEDFVFREKLMHFDHERIPERVVHARGYGAHGYFETLDDLSDITKADIFQRKGEKTPVFARFSTVAGAKGSPDLARDARGFAVKLYTKEGNWDIVGNNIPVFFIQDAIKFPDLIHSVKEEPHCGWPQAQSAHDNFYDFISLMPESMHMLMWIMSDRAIPRSFRFMQGFGVHTFKFINLKNEYKYVKFLWKPSDKYGMQSVLWNEALKINGNDADYHRKDLYNSILNGKYPEWNLYVQIFDDDFANKWEFDILDATKLIPEELIKPRLVGKMVLNQNVSNVFTDTEQVAFCTANIVPGIDFTNDPLLQGRNFSYLDTQLKRLGSTNFNQIPINRPKGTVTGSCPFGFSNFMRDGHMNSNKYHNRCNYEPNGWNKIKDENPRESKSLGFTSHASLLNDIDNPNSKLCKTRQRSKKFGDHYSQARLFYISQTKVEQEHIINALTFELSKVKKHEIRVKIVSHLLNIDKELAYGVAHGIGIKDNNMPKAIASHMKVIDLPKSDALSILKNGPQNSFYGRNVGIFCCDACNDEILTSLVTVLKEEGTDYTLISNQVNGFVTDKNNKYECDEFINGASSVLFDSIVLLLGKDDIIKLYDNQAVIDFISDAYFHKKIIGFTTYVASLFLKLNIKYKEDDDKGMIKLMDGKDCQKYIETCRMLRNWSRLQDTSQ